MKRNTIGILTGRFPWPLNACYKSIAKNRDKIKFWAYLKDWYNRLYKSGKRQRTIVNRQRKNLRTLFFWINLTKWFLIVNNWLWHILTLSNAFDNDLTRNSPKTTIFNISHWFIRLSNLIVYFVKLINSIFQFDKQFDKI